MAKLWAGRTNGQTDRLADDFNSSIGFDARMYREDIAGSMAHAAMLAKCGILSPAEARQLTEGLGALLGGAAEPVSAPEDWRPVWAGEFPELALPEGALCRRVGRRRYLALPFREGIRRPDRDNAIDLYLSEEEQDALLAEEAWQRVFTERPEPLTAAEKREYLAGITGVTVGSDAFFPFGDNVERARRSGVSYIVQPGGSIRDDNVIETADKYGITMCFTGLRLFHH